MRDLINIIAERGLTQAELSKHGGVYLKKLAQLSAGPVTLTPDAASKLGQPTVQLSPETQEAITSSAQSGSPLPPAPVFVLKNGDTVKGSWGAINKGPEYTGRTSPESTKERKAYNAGHLAELFMGLAVTAKFFNLGNPITVPQMVDMFTFSKISAHTNPKTQEITSNIVFTIDRSIDYPAAIKGNPDHLTFKGVIPGVSAEAFIQQVKTRQFTADIEAVMASAVRYVNESSTVEASIKQTQSDPRTNQIAVTSDGTSAATETKADLTLSIDGRKVNLLSLKTYSSDTLGQISGVRFDQVSQWFKTSFGIDISQYRKEIESAPDKKAAFQILLKLYDIYYPKIQAEVEDQSPNKEAAIVRHLAQAANFHARGGSGEDVEIVKLDDKIKDGNYKILKFSDNLVDAMSKLDLETKLLTGENGRTIQFFVKPEEGVKVPKGSNKLCQFRTQKMGDSYRNYFESGPMLEKLTQVGGSQVQEEVGPGSNTELVPLQKDHGIIPSNEPEIKRNNIKKYGRKFQR